VSLSANHGGGGFSCSTTPAHLTNGAASFAGCRYTIAGASPSTLTATVGSLTATATTTVNAGPTTTLAFTTAPPASANAGSTFGVVISEQDAYGNTESGDSASAVSLSANHGGGGFSCSTTPAHLTNGAASFAGCRYTVAGASPYTLTAT